MDAFRSRESLRWRLLGQDEQDRQDALAETILLILLILSKVFENSLATMRAALTRNLARANILAGEYEAATSLLLSVLAVRKGKLGEDHPNTLKTQHYLGQSYFDREMLAEAIKTLQPVVDIRSKKLGDTSRSTMNSRSLLGKCFRDQAHFEDAEKQFQAIWDNQPQLTEAPLLPAQRNRRVQTATRFIELYEAWSKPEQAAEWTKRKQEEEQRATVTPQDATP